MSSLIAFRAARIVVLSMLIAVACRTAADAGTSPQGGTAPIAQVMHDASGRRSVTIQLKNGGHIVLYESARPTDVDVARLARDGHSVTISEENGASITLPKEAWAFSYGQPIVSYNHRAAAWFVEQNFYTGYVNPIATGVDLFMDGKRAGIFGCDRGGAPAQVQIEDDSKRLAVLCSEEHGPPESYEEDFDTSSGKCVGVIDIGTDRSRPCHH